MWKNLYQKTMYEAYKTKEHLGYKIIEFENMFAVLWNNQNVPYYNIIHCDKFGQKELDIIKQNIPVFMQEQDLINVLALTVSVISCRMCFPCSIHTRRT